MSMPPDPAAAFTYVMTDIDLSVATASHHMLHTPTPGLTRAEEDAATLTKLVRDLEALIKEATDLGIYKPRGGYHARY